MRRLIGVPLTLLLVLGFMGIAAAEEIRIGGRVMTGDGRAVPEARVTLLPLSASEREALRLVQGQELEAARGSLTDREGRFELIAPHAGLWRVRVESVGFIPVEYELKPLLETIELPELALEIDTGVVIKVTDAQSVPIAGASVLLQAQRSRFRWSGSSWSTPLRGGMTDADGVLRLPGDPDEKWTLSASAAGYAPRLLRGLRGSAARVELGAGSSRTLEIRGADDKPQAGVLISTGDHLHPLGRSDAAGRFSLTLAPGDAFEISMLAEDWRRAKTRVTPAAEDKPHVVKLGDRLAIAGRLIDAETLRSIAGGIVWDRENPIEGAVSDSAGGFSLSGPAGRRISLTAGAPGYMPSATVSHQLVNDGRHAPTLALQPAAAVEGTVVDVEGAAVAGARVSVSVDHARGMMRIEIGGPSNLPTALSDARGHFRVSPLDPDNRYKVKATAEGYAQADTLVSALEPYRTKSGVRIELQSGASLIGQVVDTDGAAIRGATLSIAPSARPGGHGMMTIMDGDQDAKTFAAESDDDGKFRFDGIPAGKYDLTAKRSGFARAKRPAIELAAVTEAIDLGEISLEPGERLEGYVHDDDGSPIEGVEIHVSDGQPKMMMMMGGGEPPTEKLPAAVSDPGGWFAVDDLARGERCSLSLRRTGYVTQQVPAIEIPRVEPVQATMTAASNVIGSVLGADEQPIPGAEVNLTRSRTIEMGGNVMRTMMMESEQTNAEGIFIFEEQEPGSISLSAVASGYQEAKLDSLEIPKGEDLVDVRLPLTSGAVVQGKVMTPDGRPAVGASVTQLGERTEMIMMGGESTDGAGHYRIEGLAPGTTTIQVTHDDYPRAVKEIELEEGLNRLDLTFEGGFAVSGLVTDIAGNPIGGADLRLVTAGRSWGGPATQSSMDGTFRFPGVQDGEYAVRTEASGFAGSTGEERVTVAGAPVDGVEIRLDPGGTIVGKVSGLAPERFAEVAVSADGSSMFGGGAGVDREGNYFLEHVRAGTHSVVAELSGSARQARCQATLEAGATETRCDLVFESGITLSGRALQGERPVAGASLFANGQDLRHTGMTETDNEGRFSMEGLEPGTYDLRLQDWRTGLTHDETVSLATSREITLTVPTAQVAGRIVDMSDRSPLPGVSVVLESPDRTTREMFPTRSGTTDLDGRFYIQNVGDGSWELSANKQGYAAVTQTVTVQHDRSVDSVRLEMEPTEGLTLQALLPNGQPPAELQVAVLDGSGRSILHGSYASGENGRVRLSTVPAGSWTLLVAAPGGPTQRLSVQAPGGTVPVTLPRRCRLTVRVDELAGSASIATVQIRDATGAPYRGLDWNAQPMDDWRISGGVGEWSLPPGSWNISVTTSDGGRWQGVVNTTPEAAAELAL